MAFQGRSFTWTQLAITKQRRLLDSSWKEFGKMDGHQEYEPIKGLKILEEEGFIDLSIAVHLFCVGSSKLRSNPLRNSKVTTLSMELLYQTSNAPCQLNDLLHYSTK
ncbi:unnamed protein product [Arctogadus glacialis]